MNKYHLWVIGCQQNERDGKYLDYVLSNLGYIPFGPDEANFIIIVACAVRQTAVDRILGKLKVWKNKKIIITGCVLDKDRKKLEKRGVIVCRDKDYVCLANNIGANVNKFMTTLETTAGLSNLVPIMFGCDNFCSYCAVPYTRGRERSRDFKEIVSEIKRLIKCGNKEIMLLGQNVNSYRIENEELKIKNDNKNVKDFTILLRKLNDLPGDFMISFTSNHPKDMSDDIIEAVATLPKVKKEIHLPLQSGSDKILKAMNRPYNIKQYLEIIEKIKKTNPDIKITTDIIVGFPGETEEDFQKTVNIFKKVKYSLAYINKYSPRDGTVAYKLGDPISLTEKQRRWHILDKIVHSTK